MKYTPYPYQAFAEKFVLEHKAAGLFLDMGLGKTAITLSACEKLLRDYFETSKVLVIAPLLPARETWPRPAAGRGGGAAGKGCEGMVERARGVDVFPDYRHGAGAN